MSFFNCSNGGTRKSEHDRESALSSAPTPSSHAHIDDTSPIQVDSVRPDRTADDLAIKEHTIATDANAVHADLSPKLYTADCANTCDSLEAKINAITAINVSSDATATSRLYSGDNTSGRTHCLFPYRVTVPDLDNTLKLNIEYSVPFESLSQSDLYEIMTHQTIDAKVNPNPTIYLDIDPVVIKQSIGKRLGGIDEFDKLRHHATITQVKIIQATNTLPSDLRVQLQVASDQPSGLFYRSMVQSIGISDKAPGVAVADEVDGWNKRNALRPNQFSSTIPANHATGPINEEMALAYKIDNAYLCPEARRWMGVDLSEALAEMRLLAKEDGGKRYLVPTSQNTLIPDNIFQYIMISHAKEITWLSATSGVDNVSTKPSVNPIKQHTDPREPVITTYDHSVDAGVLEKCLRMLVDDYARFSVNFSGPMRLAVTMKNGIDGWNSLAINGKRSAAIFNPVRINVIVEVEFIPFVSETFVNDEMKLELAREKEAVVAYKEWFKKKVDIIQAEDLTAANVVPKQNHTDLLKALAISSKLLFDQQVEERSRLNALAVEKSRVDEARRLAEQESYLQPAVAKTLRGQ